MVPTEKERKKDREREREREREKMEKRPLNPNKRYPPLLKIIINLQFDFIS